MESESSHHVAWHECGDAHEEHRTAQVLHVFQCGSTRLPENHGSNESKDDRLTHACLQLKWVSLDGGHVSLAETLEHLAASGSRSLACLRFLSAENIAEILFLLSELRVIELDQLLDVLVIFTRFGVVDGKDFHGDVCWVLELREFYLAFIEVLGHKLWSALVDNMPIAHEDHFVEGHVSLRARLMDRCKNCFAFASLSFKESYD